MVKSRNVKRDQFLNFYIHPYEQLIAGLFCLNLADVYSKCLGCQSYQVVIHKIKSSIRIFFAKPEFHLWQLGKEQIRILAGDSAPCHFRMSGRGHDHINPEKTELNGSMDVKAEQN